MTILSNIIGCSYATVLQTPYMVTATGNCKTWTLECGLDSGPDSGPQFGLAVSLREGAGPHEISSRRPHQLWHTRLDTTASLLANTNVTS